MLTINDISKFYTPATLVLKNITLIVEEGEIVCLLGPSGCGKTTLLRIVAGLEQPDAGQIMLAGRDLSTLPVHQRNFGLMFQEFALFPHRTVAENVAFGLRMAGQRRAQIAERVQEVLALVNLEGYDARSIFALSGGERQRVALARSLAPRPRLLMLDEPLGSLDRALREELMVELRAILKAVGVTALYVTHDQQEAFAVADRLVVMHQGQIAQVGTAQAIYDTPATAFVARFLGFHNLFPPSAVGTTTALSAIASGAQHQLPRQADNVAGVEPALLIRPDAVRALGCGAGAAATETETLVVTGKVQALLFRGSYYQLTLALDPVKLDEDEKDELGKPSPPTQLRFDLPTVLMRTVADCFQVGEPIWLELDPKALLMIE